MSQVNIVRKREAKEDKPKRKHNKTQQKSRFARKEKNLKNDKKWRIKCSSKSFVTSKEKKYKKKNRNIFSKTGRVQEKEIYDDDGELTNCKWH